jgi:hypothetical protein
VLIVLRGYEGVASWCLLCCWEVVCQAHVESVALLRAEVIEDGLDLPERHLLLEVGEGGLPFCADGSECAWSEPLGS